MAVLGTAFVMLNLLYLDKNWLSRLLSHSALYPWARVSYGMYLTHTYILCMLMQWKDIFPHSTNMKPLEFLTLYTATVLATFLVAMLMFLCVERPLMDWGAKFSQRFTKTGKT